MRPNGSMPPGRISVFKRFLRANLARSVEKYERAALFTGCRVFAFPHRTKRKRATMSFCMKKAVLFPRAMSQVGMPASIFGECREDQKPCCLQRGF